MHQISPKQGVCPENELKMLQKKWMFARVKMDVAWVKMDVAWVKMDVSKKPFRPKRCESIINACVVERNRSPRHSLKHVSCEIGEPLASKGTAESCSARP